MSSNRRFEAQQRRESANQLANGRLHPRHIQNSDEQKFRHTKETEALHDEATKDQPSYMMSYTKGMPHNEETGLVDNPDHFQLFVKGIDSGDPRDFRDIPLGNKENYSGYKHKCKNEEFNWKSKKAQNHGNPVHVRAWESQGAGNLFDLEGPDAQSVTMPPVPALGSKELTAEMAEVYTQALLRDVPFNAYSAGVMGIGVTNSKEDISTLVGLDALETKKEDVEHVQECSNRLNQLDWFQNTKSLDLNTQEQERRRAMYLSPSNAFRGITPGDDIGPYLSQFLLVGNKGINSMDNERSPKEGLISYGAISTDQKVRTAKPNQDYITDWNQWLDVQNGADLRGFEEYDNTHKRRFIHTPRDLATYVHYDALYEAYLNACIIMLGNGVPFDPGIPFQAPDNVDHQQGFAHFGGPHILSLVTEVATRALKAVRFQKFNVHRRPRPEVLAARIYKAEELKEMSPEVVALKRDLDTSNGIDLLSKIRTHNAQMNPDHNETELLPMAFCEGSPMHPAYGAGHATVAGACVTVLKAFFDHKHPLNIVPVDSVQKEVVNLVKKITNNPGFKASDLCSSNLAYVSVQNGKRLDTIPVLDQNCNLAKLTVEGELNKLASNISIGRNWAGVHYFTDYYESILMGEQIALGILEEQKLTFNENFSMTVPLFNGDTIRI